MKHNHTRGLARMTLIAAAAMSALAAHAAGVNTLVGWASLPAATVAEGPTTGHFGGTGFGANSGLLPILNGQSVQGFSAVLDGPTSGSYYVMPDNGFGTKANSADALLRVYAMQPDFKAWNGTAVTGTGTVTAVNYNTGVPQGNFSSSTFISLRDTDSKLLSPIQANYTNYYNNPANPSVDATIKANRLLTGADFDIESMRKDKNGNLWFGEEFGPFLIKTDATGKVLRSEVSLPGVFAPENPLRGSTPSNLGSSRGFEGMAINKAGDKLFTLLEGTVTGDAAKTLRINEFSVDSESFTGASWKYKLDTDGTNIGDMTMVNDHTALVLERNGGTGTSGTPFKKVYKIDLSTLDADGYAQKTELIDLMDIADPHDLNGDGNTTFTFPYVTIEDILLVDDHTVLIMNDNNFPGGGGRSASPDINEFLMINLANPVPEPESWALALGGLALVGQLARRKAR
jgi:hypothetical protein